MSADCARSNHLLRCCVAVPSSTVDTEDIGRSSIAWSQVRSTNWCLEDSSCCDFLTLYFVCYMSIDCSGGLAQRVSAQILIFWLTMCAWHQQSVMLHVLAALCMTTYTLVSCDPWTTGSFSLLSSICWKSHLYYTCTKCVCITFSDWKS